MELTEEFERYLEHVSEGLGRSGQKAGLKSYCGADVALEAQEYGAPGGSDRSASRASASRVAATFRIGLAVVGRACAQSSAKLGDAEDVH